MTLRWWTGALIVSAAIHVALALALSGNIEAVDIAGGGSTEIAVLGNAFVDATSAGAIEDIRPDNQYDDVQNITDLTTPAISPDTLAAQTAEHIELVPPDPFDPQAVIVSLAEPLAADRVNAIATAVQPVAAQPVEAAAMVAPSVVEPVAAELATAAPIEIADDAIEAPVPPIRTVPSIPREQLYPQPVQSAPRPQGAGGASQADATRGTAIGSQAAVATAQSQSAASTVAGNAAVSNYPGQVANKLRRALRYPASARGATGEASVQFIVDAQGALVAVSLVAGTGNAALDQAALDTVRRAAPFPPIPPAANRSQWTFTMPLGFVR